MEWRGSRILAEEQREELGQPGDPAVPQFLSHPLTRVHPVLWVYQSTPQSTVCSQSAKAWQRLMFSVSSHRVGSQCQEGSAWDGTVQTPVWAWHCMWVPAPHPVLGAASERDKSIVKTGGGHPAVVVLKASGVLGKPPWEMSLCLGLLRQGRELDLTAHMGTFEFCTVVGTTLTVVLFSRRAAFLLHRGPLLLPTVWVFFKMEII